MVSLTVERKWKKKGYTIGNLYVNDAKFSNTLEDVDRGLKQTDSTMTIAASKVKGSTAIPSGIYEVTMKVISPKYSQKPAFSFTGGYMPRLTRVPGFDGILIHSGNTAADTEGCILVGKNTEVGKVTDSFNTFRKLYTILRSASDRGEKIVITIKD